MGSGLLCQVDEIWGFVGAKVKNADPETKAAGEAGDAWVWVAIDADTKLVPQWYVGARNLKSCARFITGLAERIQGRFQLTTDAFHIYREVVDAILGADIDYGQVVKVFGSVPEAVVGRYSPAQCIGAKIKKISGNPDEKHISTSYAERNNLNIRMHQRRMTRLTNAFQRRSQTMRTQWRCIFSITISCGSIRRFGPRPRWPLASPSGFGKWVILWTY